MSVEPAPKKPAAPARLRVLVVEDSEDDFEFLCAFLAKGPWRVEARRVEDAEGLSAALAEGGWDVVISDHSLPRLDSIGALRLVRESDSGAPFIIVSGRIGEDVAVDAMLAGADDYVLKHNLARLRPAIERSLAARELRRQKLEAEARERESQSRLEAIAAHLPGVVFQLRQAVAGEPPVFVYLSDGARALLGENPATLLARPERLAALTAHGPGEPLAAHVAAAGRSGAPIGWEGRVGAAPHVRWVSVKATPRTVGTVRLWDGILVDVSALKHAEAELRRLGAEWEKRMEEERAAIARELHDEVGGTLMALKADVDWLRRRAADSAEMRVKTADMAELVDSLLASARRLSAALRPELLDLGIVGALEAKCAEFASRIGVSCRFRTNAEELALAPERALALYRVVQEALTNAARHAGAARVDVELFATAREVTLEIRDDGRGIAPEDLAKPGSFGLRGMRERLERLGGWVEITGAPGRGTTIMAGIERA